MSIMHTSEPRQRTLDRWLWGISLVVAPLLLAAATFFWQEGSTAGRGALVVLPNVFWIPAFIGPFDLVGRGKSTRRSTLGPSAQAGLWPMLQMTAPPTAHRFAGASDVLQGGTAK